MDSELGHIKGHEPEQSYRESNSMGYECGESAVCSQCGAPFSEKSRVRNASPDNFNGMICPACMRIANRYPAGFVEVKGPFLEEYPDEVLGLICETAVQATEEHPLERIMAVIHDNKGIVITTTGTIIAQRIGEAVARTYSGNLRVQNADDEEFIRVFWEP